MSELEPCPNCGTGVDINQGGKGMLLMGVRSVKCPGCGIELEARAQIQFGVEGE